MIALNRSRWNEKKKNSMKNLNLVIEILVNFSASTKVLEFISSSTMKNRFRAFQGRGCWSPRSFPAKNNGFENYFLRSMCTKKNFHRELDRKTLWTFKSFHYYLLNLSAYVGLKRDRVPFHINFCNFISLSLPLSSPILVFSGLYK